MVLRYQHRLYKTNSPSIKQIRYDEAVPLCKIIDIDGPWLFRSQIMSLVSVIGYFTGEKLLLQDCSFNLDIGCLQLAHAPVQKYQWWYIWAVQTCPAMCHTAFPDEERGLESQTKLGLIVLVVVINFVFIFLSLHFSRFGLFRPASDMWEGGKIKTPIIDSIGEKTLVPFFSPGVSVDWSHSLTVWSSVLYPGVPRSDTALVKSGAIGILVGLIV